MFKAGVIGVGHLGRFHARKYAALDQVELVGVADTDRSQAEAVAAELGVLPFYSHWDMLDQVDAVSIAAPTVEHFALAQDALEAGVHVLVEKPITRTLDEADQLIALAEEKGLVLQVGHVERFNPAWIAAEPLTDRPLFIEANRVSPFPKRGTDVDVVLDLMIHDLDLVLHLAGGEPKLVQAVGQAVVTPLIDVANARLEFENGCVANLNASRVALQSRRRLRIFQDNAFLAVDFGERQATVARGPFDRNEITAEDLPVSDSDALFEEIGSFVRAVRESRVPKVTGWDGRLALATALKIVAAIEARREDWLAASCD